MRVWLFLLGVTTIAASFNTTVVTSCLTGFTVSRIKDLKRYLKCKEGDLSCQFPAK